MPVPWQYHQDVHVPPHLTLYNQTSGASAFHFLPLLVGLYATRLGRNQGPHALASLLATLQQRRVGQTATIGPGQLLLILPAGAHGVFVPRVPAGGSHAVGAHAGGGDAPGIAPFELSLIRAAEIYVWPLYALHERRCATAGWAAPFALTAEEREAEATQSRAFEARQQAVCAELGLGRDEWFTLARRLWAKWETADGADQGD